MRIIPLLFLSLSIAGGPAFGAELLLSGSTTVQSRILAPLAPDIKAATGIDIKVEGIGSGNGLKRLVAGEVPAAIVSDGLGGLLEAQKIPDNGTYMIHVLIEDEIGIIVNAANPVSELSPDQLRGILTGEIGNWKEVGGPDLKTQVVTSHPASATRAVVWEQVMSKKADYARNSLIVYATKKEMVLVAQEKGGIGAVSLGFFNAYAEEARKLGDPVEVKVVKAQKIARPLGIVTKGDPSPDVAKLITYLRTEAAQKKFK